jgi:hypoxanthine phosphoribosyltransferase
VQIVDRIFEPYIDQNTVENAILRVAKEINKDYDGKSIVFLGILNGAFMFCADLMKNIQVEADISFVKLSSYQGTKSGGTVHELIGLMQSLKNKHVVIVEDIVDTGLTLDKIFSMIDGDQPASVEVATLLFKPSAYKGSHVPKYIGIEIPDEFVVGYGMDYQGIGRNIPAIYKLKN